MTKTDITEPVQLPDFTYLDHPIHLFNINGKPWWKLADVCAALNILNASTVAHHLKHDPTLLRIVGNDHLVSELGLYRFIFRSHKPEALSFQRWVCDEMMPAVRNALNENTDDSAMLQELDALKRRSEAIRIVIQTTKQSIDEICSEARSEVEALERDTIPVWFELRKLRSEADGLLNHEQ